MNDSDKAITKTLSFTFRSIWVAKWHHFVKKSVWRHLLAAFLVAFSWIVFKELSLTSQEVLYDLVYFGIGFLLFGMAVNLLAVALQVKRLKNRIIKAIQLPKVRNSLLI